MTDRVRAKTVLSLDMVGYSKRAAPLDADAVARLNASIQQSIRDALLGCALEHERNIITTTGDGALLVFDQPRHVHEFAAVFAGIVAAGNRALADPSLHRKYRLGAATGELASWDNRGHIEYAGAAIGHATRIESLCRPGELTVDLATFAGLPEKWQALYGDATTRRAKHGETFTVRAWLIVASMPRPQPRPTGALWNVPPLPEYYVARESDSDELVRALCDASERSTNHVGITAAPKRGVLGMGGIGKTVLAAAVARTDAIRAHFTDGVYWLTVGQTPQLTSLQAQLARALGLLRSAFDSEVVGWQELSEALADKRVLLVLDDVWLSEHVRWLVVTGVHGRALITTRKLDVLRSGRAHVHALDVLSEAQSRSLLAEWTETRPEDLPDEALAVIEACGRLPLALSMAGALVCRPAVTWKHILRWLEEARLDRLCGPAPDYPYRSVYQVIEASVAQLAGEGTVPHVDACYADLAVFAEDEAAPRDALRVLWARHGLDDGDGDMLAGLLASSALATVQEVGESWTLSLHDLQRAYARACSPDVRARNAALIDGYRARCAHGLERGPTDGTDRQYFFLRLPYHLIEAGRMDELCELLWSYAWLEAKLRESGVLELIADFERVQRAGGSDRWLDALRDSLRLSCHVLAGHPDQLPSQLVGRLLALEHESPRIAALLRDARAHTSHPWLCPLHPNLMPPGGPLVLTLDAHRDSVNAIALDALGNLAASGSDDTTVRVWNLATGQLMHTLEGHAASVNAVALSPDGTRAASGSSDRTIKIWDTATGELVYTLEGHREEIRSLAYSGDGKRLLSGSSDQSAKFWLASDGKLLRTLTGHSSWVTGVALDMPGRVAVTVSFDRQLIVWNTSTGEQVHILGDSEGWLRAVALSPDGATALTGSDDRKLRLWDVRAGRLIESFAGHRGPITGVALSGDGTCALSGGHDSKVKLWDMTSRALLAVYDGHSSMVMDVASSPDGKRALSCSHDQTIKLWDTGGARHERQLPGHSTPIMSVSLSADARWAVSGSRGGRMKLWDVTTGRLEREFGGHTGPVTSALISPDGARVLSSSIDGTVRVWDAHEGRQERVLRGHGARMQPRRGAHVLCLAQDPDHARAVSGGSDRTLRVWNTDSGALLRTLEGHTSPVVAVAVDARRGRVLSGSSDRTVKLWDLDTGRLLRTATGHASVTSVALDSRAADAHTNLALAGHADGSIKLWDLSGSDALATFPVHAAVVTAVLFDPDGMHALSASADRTIKLWHLASGAIVATFVNDATVASMALGASEPPLIVAGDDLGGIHFLHLLR